MRSSSIWGPAFAFISIIVLLIGSMMIIISDDAGVNAIEPIHSPTTVTAGETFSYTVEPVPDDLVLEAKYPGINKNWIIEPKEKGDLGWNFELRAPYSGTNISLRIAYWVEVNGEKVLEPQMEWVAIEVTGWIDEDGDGLSDTWEELHDLDSDDPNEDVDEDGIINLEEMYHLSDPTKVDTDGDSMDDEWEISNGLLPFKNDPNDDPDRDDWSNIQEFVEGTDPRDTASHPKEPRATPWYWIVIIFGVLFLILGYFVKQLFSKKKLEDDLDDFDRNASKPAKGNGRDNSGKI